MSEDKKAGQLILSQLKMFNEAVVLFENVISPAINRGIDSCVENFVEKNDWLGEFEFESDNKKCWLAPGHWCSNPAEEDPEFRAWFEIECIEDGDNYWAALFCGVATQGGEAGFKFCINPRIFGGKNAWNASAKKIPQDIILKLEGLGFKNLGRGEFFLPVLLDSQKMSQSWFEFGEFTKDDECFTPLCAALEKLKQAVQTFDQVMQNCAASNSGK